jgi:hypothetical protein
MNADQKFWLTLWLIFGTTIVSVAAICTRYYTEQYKLMIQSGYEEGTLPGKVGTYWVKGDTK